MISASIAHSKVLGANMGPTWDRKDLGGPHVGHTNLAIWDIFVEKVYGEDQSVVYRMFWSLLHTLFLYLIANYMDNFIVVASYLKPPPPSGENLHFATGYKRCGRFLGHPPGMPTTLLCEPGVTGQYVYIYLTQPTHLAVCEFEVYGERK